MGLDFSPWLAPQELAYDFAAAAEARDQAERLAGRLALLRDLHREHVERPRRDWEGDTRERFDRRFTFLLGELEVVVAALRGQAADLADELERARVARARRAEAIEEWQRDWERYQDALSRSGE